MRKHNTTEQRPLEKTAKKPYLKPSFEREKVFETQALICGKMEEHARVDAIRTARPPDRHCCAPCIAAVAA